MFGVRRIQSKRIKTIKILFLLVKSQGTLYSLLQKENNNGLIKLISLELDRFFC